MLNVFIPFSWSSPSKLSGLGINLAPDARKNSTRIYARQIVRLTSKLNHGRSSETKNHSGSVRGVVLWKTVGDFRYASCTVFVRSFRFFFFLLFVGGQVFCRQFALLFNKVERISRRD